MGETLSFILVTAWGLLVIFADYLVYRMGVQMGLPIVVRVSKLAIVLAALATLTLIARIMVGQLYV